MVLASVGAERRQHSGDQTFVAFYGWHRQSPMPQKPIPEGAKGRRSFSRCIRKRSDGTLMPQIVSEAPNTCCIGSRNVLQAAASRTLAAMCSESLDGLFVNIRKVQATGFCPPTEVNGCVQVAGYRQASVADRRQFG